jgi:replication factor A2
MQETLPPAAQTNAYPQVPYNGGVREHQVQFTPQVNQGQLQVQRANISIL